MAEWLGGEENLNLTEGGRVKRYPQTGKGEKNV